MYGPRNSLPSQMPSVIDGRLYPTVKVSVVPAGMVPVMAEGDTLMSVPCMALSE